MRSLHGIHACLALLLVGSWASGMSAGDATKLPSPSGDGASASHSFLPPSVLLGRGLRGLDHGDPSLALGSFRRLLEAAGENASWRRRARLGLGRAWMMLGRADLSLRYAEALLREDRRDPGARALEIRALLRNGDFPEALRRARRARADLGGSDPDLNAAYASALYRNRRLREAERSYRSLLATDLHQVEALVRLGTGLLSPRPAPALPPLLDAVGLQKAGAFREAENKLHEVLKRDPVHPLALRLLGELLLSRNRKRSPLVESGILERIWSLRAPAGEAPPWIRRFLKDWDRLSPLRRRVALASLTPFGSWLRIAVANGATHDFLMEVERTTADPDRAWLRGRKTFDGRVWDDVRGMGGKHAATGVEALDEALEGGFQTFVHEVAHQVHLYALPEGAKRRIESLYLGAKREGLLLDYYAAANSAEYFAQGVEAWFSFAKAAGQPITHGHTRRELARKDPALASFLAELFEDGLEPSTRAELRRLALEAAVLTGRVEDALELAGAEGAGVEAEIRMKLLPFRMF